MEERLIMEDQQQMPSPPQGKGPRRVLGIGLLVIVAYAVANYGFAAQPSFTFIIIIVAIVATILIFN